jgi:NAD(P)-dependent dehydrogenase (short-subunit alcohol dehydrogenase family)
MADPNNSTLSPPSLEQTSFETSFYDKVYAITGGSSGIGFSTARILARYGARVAICARNKERLSKAVSELTTLSPWGADGVLFQAVDVSIESEVDNFIAATVEKFGQLDGAVNSAAVEGSYTTPLEKVDTALWNSVIAANLTGTMFSVRAEIRSMKSGGSIVNVASILSKIAMAGNAPYVASKHGVIGLTKAVAKEMGPKGIRVNALSP